MVLLEQPPGRAFTYWVGRGLHSPWDNPVKSDPAPRGLSDHRLPGVEGPPEGYLQSDLGASLVPGGLRHVS